ncbi:MAG: alanine racemase [Armatimonadota bacterium]|nr:alanine racemase [bacterium]
MTHDVWVEVDLAALKHNFAQVKNVVGNGVKITAVVKSNGFGHGYVEPAKAFIEAGADMLAVTRLDEAIILREAGIESPTLLFAPIQPENAEIAVNADLEMTISTIELAHTISDAAQRLGKTAQVHVKIDTGMGRLGVSIDDAHQLIQHVHQLPSLEIAGVYTHFATTSEQDASSSKLQLERFTQLLTDLRRSDIDYGLAHCANSAAIIRMPDSHMDMVRPGTILYGQYPSTHVPHTLDLKSTWKLKARICEVKELKSGSPVGYGGEFVTRRITKTAIVPIGYADGFTLAPEGPIYRQSALKFAVRKVRKRLFLDINGRKAPVIGRIAMQMTVIDITNFAHIRVGDEVTVPAMRIPTSALVPRVYVG